jgi:multiple sugar transport system permease protein
MTAATLVQKVRSRAEQRRIDRAGFEAPTTPLVQAIGIPLTLFFVLFPIVWMGMTSFKPRRLIYTLQVLFTPTLENFRTIFSPEWAFGGLMLNSVIVTTSTILVAIPVATLAAYGFSRLDFRGNNTLFVGLLATQFVPPVAIALPFFLLYRDLNLIDTRVGLVVINLSILVPYATWLIKGFIDSVPIEVEEAGMVDGCSPLSVIFRVTVPLAVPGIMVATVFTFVASWNEFLYALMTTRREAVTLPVGLMRTISAEGILWELMSAGGMLVMVPMLALSVAIRNYFAEGITLGSVK